MAFLLPKENVFHESGDHERDDHQTDKPPYPSLIAAVSDASHPAWRARSLSVYRFWRDLGNAIGALSAGLIADAFGLPAAIASIAALTFVSGAVVWFAMVESRAR